VVSGRIYVEGAIPAFASCD